MRRRRHHRLVLAHPNNALSVALITRVCLLPFVVNFVSSGSRPNRELPKTTAELPQVSHTGGRGGGGGGDGGTSASGE